MAAQSTNCKASSLSPQSSTLCLLSHYWSHQWPDTIWTMSICQSPSSCCSFLMGSCSTRIWIGVRWIQCWGLRRGLRWVGTCWLRCRWFFCSSGVRISGFRVVQCLVFVILLIRIHLFVVICRIWWWPPLFDYET